MYRISLLAALALFALVPCLAQSGPEAKPKSASLVVTLSQGRLKYEVNDKRIAGNANALLNELGKLHSLNSDVRLNLFFHQDVRLTDIYSTEALVGKVGFTYYHIYCFDRNRLGITEISFGNENPFTLNPW